MDFVTLLIGAALLVIVFWAINTYVTNRVKTPLLIIVAIIGIIFLIYALIPGARIR